MFGNVPIFSVTTVGDQFSENWILGMSLRRGFRMMMSEVGMLPELTMGPGSMGCRIHKIHLSPAHRTMLPAS